MLTIGLMEILYNHFGVVVEINDGKITNLYIESEGKK